MARSYVNRLARFSSADPAGLAAVDPSNPQSWNRYAYVMNNPVANVDPLGLVCNGVNNFMWDPLADGTGIFTPEDCAQSGGTWGGYGLTPGGGGDPGGGQGPSGGGMPGCTPAPDSDNNQTGVPGSPVCPASNTSAGGRAVGGRGGNSSWTGTFVKTFVNGVLHGDRQPGESFGACVNRNISETTFGTVDPQKLAKAIPAEAVGLAGALAGKVPFNIPFDPGTGGISAFTASAYGLVRALGISGAGTGALVGAANGVGYGLAIAGAATAGLTIGSAINCR